MLEEEFFFDEFDLGSKTPDTPIARTPSQIQMDERKKHDEYIRQKAAEIREKTEKKQLSRASSQMMTPELARNLNKRQRMIAQPRLDTKMVENKAPKAPKMYILPEKKKMIVVEKPKSVSKPKKSRAKIQMPKMTYIPRAKPQLSIKQAITPSPLA